MKIYYRLYLSDNFEMEIPDSFSLTRKTEQEEIAKMCAKDYFLNHDGYNENWPLPMVLMDENKNKIANFDVDVEFDPSFIVMKHL